MGHFYPPRLGAIGAGESALFIAEQFALQQRARNRRAIYFHVWAGTPRRKPVNHAGDNVFAGAAFALDENGNIRSGDFGQPFAQQAHRVGFSENGCFRREFSQRLN